MKQPMIIDTGALANVGCIPRTLYKKSPKELFLCLIKINLIYFGMELQ